MTDWSQLVQQHGPTVWKTALRMVGNEADAGDCFQDAFVSAVEVARRESVRHWPALLKRLAVTRSLECLRRRYRVNERMTVPLASTPVEQRGVGPLQALQASELAEALRKHLAELEPRQAEVFCMACIDGLSYRDVARQLDITVNHVGVLLNRARSTLRERMHAFDLAKAASPTTSEAST